MVVNFPILINTRRQKMYTKTKTIRIFVAVATVVFVFGMLADTASAACNNGSVNVAFVPDTAGPGGGYLPTTHSAFNKFSFTIF